MTHRWNLAYLTTVISHHNARGHLSGSEITANFLKLCLSFLILFVFLSSPKATADIQLSEQMPGNPITGGITVIEDPERKLTLEEVLARDWSGFETDIQSQKSVRGISSSAWWVVLDVENTNTTQIDWVFEAVYTHTDFLDFYHLDADGNMNSIFTGDKRPFANRPMSSQSYAFPLQTRAASKEKIILRMVYEEAGMIELLVRSWDPKAFQEYQTTTSVLYGGLIGSGLLIIIFTLIIYIPSRLPAFYWYLGYLTFVLANFVANTGLGHRFIWHDSPFLTDSAHILLAACAFACALQFNRVFLQTKRLMPRADKLLLTFIGMVAVGGALYLLGFRALSGKLLILTAILLSVMPLIGLWAWKVLKRNDARWYVIAWSIWSISVVIIVGRLTGALEMSNTTIWISRTGLLLEAVFLGFALIDHVNTLRRDKLAAEEKLIDSLENSNKLLEEKVLARTAELEKARFEAEVMAETDPLTGVGNRRYFMSRGEESLKLAQRLGQPLSLVMLDIDHFKKINDSKGHATGDLVIQHVAGLCKARLRETDILGRIGGEEFAVVLMGAEPEQAFMMAEQLRKAIADSVIRTPEGEISFTASFGVAIQNSETSHLEVLLHQADIALYQAKETGRNRVCSTINLQPELCP